jgi:hypothetical protein
LADEEEEEVTGGGSGLDCGFYVLFFLLWWMGVFAGIFAETSCVNVVFLWSSCGEMCGKRGQLTARFSSHKNRTPFPGLFSA